MSDSCADTNDRRRAAIASAVGQSCGPRSKAGKATFPTIKHSVGRHPIRVTPRLSADSRRSRDRQLLLFAADRGPPEVRTGLSADSRASPHITRLSERRLDFMLMGPNSQNL